MTPSSSTATASSQANPSSSTPPQWRVPLFEPDFGPLELEAVTQPLRDQWITMGETTARLESQFAQAGGFRHAIAITNCTAALHLAMAAAGVGPGDEVIVPTLTFVATVNAVKYVGATPVFCDSAGERDLNIDLDRVEALVTPRTKAVVAVHYAGFPVDMDRLTRFACSRGLTVIEDCAHALFSSVGGRTCGAWGLMGCFSFFGNKNMTCGEGGMITTQSDEIAARLRIMRSHGMTTMTLDRFKGRATSYDVVEHGYNYRMEDLRSSVALAQLRRLPGFLERRALVRERYLAGLDGSSILVPDFGFARMAREGDSVGHHIMPVILPVGVDRAAVMARLKERGVQTSIHYPCVHRFSAFAGANAAGLERTESLAARELTLPMYPTMREDQVRLVCRELREAIAA